MLPGSKILLRTFKEADLLPVLEFRNAAALQMPYNGQPLSTHSQLASRYQKTGFWGQAEGGGRMLICGLDEALLGEIDFSETSTHTMTISYMLFRQSDYGKGYTAEALRPQLRFQFAADSNFRSDTYDIRKEAGSNHFRRGAL